MEYAAEVIDQKLRVDWVNNQSPFGMEMKFIEDDCHWLPQSEYVFLENGCRVCDDIIRTEDLLNQMRNLFSVYGIEIRSLPPRVFGANTSPCKEKFGPETLPKNILELINTRYKNDFINFGYEMIT